MSEREYSFKNLFTTNEYIAELEKAAIEAGAEILRVREEAICNPQFKYDGSPVTRADTLSQEIILAHLSSLTPKIPIIAEEKTNSADLIAGGTYWLVDPLDSTKDFIDGGNQFSVNIGLVINHIPTLGVIFAPGQNVLTYGEPGTVFSKTGSNLTPILPTHTVNAPGDPFKGTDIHLITSFREGKKMPIKKWLDEGIIKSWKHCSSAYKFSFLASGECNLYPRTGRTYEWDTAAGDAILRALGGGIITSSNTPLVYGKPDFINSTFLAYGAALSPAAITQFLALTQK